MSNNTSSSIHLQNLNSLKNYIKNLDSHLNQLGHNIGADLKSNDAALNKGILHPRKYLPKTPKTSASFQEILYMDLLGGNSSGYTNTSVTGSSTYRTSSGQIWAQIASGISKAMQRGL